ncbi:MAG: glycosyltransferase [Elusimicrobiota bacterium]
MSNSNPFFTVIIVTYNRAGLLKSALRSLDGQTFKDFEAFIIDDGSSDETKTVFREFSGHAGWHFIEHTDNKGYPARKNEAFRKASGRYITFLDSDDVWLPGKLEIFREFAVSNPTAGFIFSNGYIHQDGRIISKMFDENTKIPSGRLPAYMAISNHWLPYVTTNVALKREAVEKAGTYREDMTYLGDTEYFARVIKDFDTGVIPEPLSVYRIHALSITQNRDRCIEESIISLESANPPAEIYDMLHDLVYRSQAVVLIKNGLCGKARELLRKMKRKNTDYLKTYISSLLPAFILAAIRFLFKKFRTAKLTILGPEDFKNAENYLLSLDK